jgi:hypothetical protein
MWPTKNFSNEADDKARKSGKRNDPAHEEISELANAKTLAQRSLPLVQASVMPPIQEQLLSPLI